MLEIWTNLVFLFILLNPSCFLSLFYSILDLFLEKITFFLEKSIHFAALSINAFVNFVSILSWIPAFFLNKIGLKKIFSAQIFIAVKYYDIFGFGPIILRASPDKEFYLNLHLLFLRNENFRKFI